MRNGATYVKLWFKKVCDLFFISDLKQELEAHMKREKQFFKMLDNYILKNLELILYPASVFQDIMRIQNPQHASVTSPFMGYILECLKKCFAHRD